MTKTQANEPGFVLAPCPFCGGRPSDTGVIRYDKSTARDIGDGKQREYFFCNCTRCGVSNQGLTGHRTKERAAAAWNRRAPSPIVPAPAYGVKELEWNEITAARSDEDPSHEPTGDYEAVTGIGIYYVECGFGSDSYVFSARLNGDDLSNHDDPVLAKAAAQADFERRILSCLSSAPVEEADETGERLFLIRKRGAYYRPNEQGYTSSTVEAGRYSRADAERITHPNGSDGPRDGMDYVPAPSSEAAPVEKADAKAGLPKLKNCGRYLAQDNTGQWFYINHANTWQTFQGPDKAPSRWARGQAEARDLAIRSASTIPSEPEAKGEAGAGPVACSSCDGTGDITRMDGEWLGWCPCGAAGRAGAGPVGEAVTFEFDRYIDGTLMAEGVKIERQTTLEKASMRAAQIASRGPNGEVPVLVLRSPLYVRPVEEPGGVERITRDRDFWVVSFQVEVKARIAAEAALAEAWAVLGDRHELSLADEIRALMRRNAQKATDLAETRERLEKDREIERRHWQAKVDALNAECETTLLRAETAEIALAAREAAR